MSYVLLQDVFSITKMSLYLYNYSLSLVIHGNEFSRHIFVGYAARVLVALLFIVFSSSSFWLV